VTRRRIYCGTIATPPYFSRKNAGDTRRTFMHPHVLGIFEIYCAGTF